MFTYRLHLADGSAARSVGFDPDGSAIMNGVVPSG